MTIEELKQKVLEAIMIDPLNEAKERVERVFEKYQQINPDWKDIAEGFKFSNDLLRSAAEQYKKAVEIMREVLFSLMNEISQMVIWERETGASTVWTETLKKAINDLKEVDQLLGEKND